jgi:hypothetical protein
MTTTTEDGPDNTKRVASAETALDAFATATGLTADITHGYSPEVVSGLIAALCHYVAREDNPADVLVRGVRTYDKECGLQGEGSTEVGGAVIAAAMAMADEDTTTTPSLVLNAGLAIYTEQKR